MVSNLKVACRGSLGFESRKELIASATGEAGKKMKVAGQEFGNRIERW